MSQVIPEMRNVDGHYYGSLYTVAALDGQTKTHLLECLSEVVEDSSNSCVLLCGHNRGWWVQHLDLRKACPCAVEY